MIKKIKTLIAILTSVSIQAQFCSDLPEIASTSSAICVGQTSSLSINIDSQDIYSCTGTSSLNYLNFTPITNSGIFTNIIKNNNSYFLRSDNDVLFSNSLTGPYTSLNFNNEIAINLAAELLGIDNLNRLHVATGHNGLFIYDGANWSSGGLSGFGTSGQYFTKLSNGRILITKSGSLRGIYYSDNNGSSWTKATTVDVDWNNITVASNGDLYASSGIGGVGTSGVVKSTDNGSTWTYINTILGISTSTGIFKDCEDDLYIVGDRKIFKSIDLGSNWEQITTLPTFITTLPSYGEFIVASNGDFYYIGDNKLYFSSNKGNNWVEITSISGQIRKIKEIDGNIVVCSTQGVFAKKLTNSATYLWSTGETSSSISVSPTTTSNYWVDIISGSLTCRKNVTINVIPATPAPTGNPIQLFCATPVPTTIDLIASGTDIQWYSTETGGAALANTTPLIDGSTYYASKLVNGCESNNRLAVSINLMNPIITASATTVCKGSPVNLQVNISPTSPIDPRWELLIPPSNYNGTQINLSETAYDRINNYVYSLFKQGSNLITYRFNLNNNSVSNIVTTNIPNNVSTFTYDYSNNRLIAGRTGRDIISAVPANGGAWSQIGNGSFDAESYGSQYYWNSNNQKTGFFGGYGFFYVRNWIWENGSSWTNSFANNNNCGINIPAKRVTQLALGKPNTNKIYFFSGQGSCTGQQTVSSCNLGSPWATDVGVFCWLKDLWELDLNTQTFNNILPVNSSSITKEGNFVYNYTENSFYIVGGYSPSPIYNSNFGNITNYETSILKYDPSINSGFIPFVVQGTPPPALTLNSIGVNKSYYDAANNQIVWIRKDGVWAVKLGSTSSINSILWSTGETTSSINPSPLETTTYWVDVTANGITCRKSITINVQNSPPPSGSESQSFCEGKSIEDIAINGSSIKWYPLINSNNPINRNSLLSNATNYFASQTINGCESEDRLEVNIQITHPEKPTGETIQRFCNSKTINDLSVIGSDIKWYSTSVSLMTLNNTSVLSDGESYYATQTINGCESENRFKTTVNLISIPNVNGSSPQVFCTEDQSTLKNIVVNGGTPQWYSTFTNGSPISESQKLQDKTTYYASNIDKVSGCESPQRLAVSIELINCDVVIFNSIKVDAEPMSDRLYIDDISYFPNNSIQIFNRYGRLVWETKGYNNDSNAFKGKANVPDLFQKDEQLPAGTYFYILNYFNFIDRTQKEKNGYLQLFNRN